MCWRTSRPFLCPAQTGHNNHPRQEPQRQQRQQPEQPPQRPAFPRQPQTAAPIRNGLQLIHLSQIDFTIRSHKNKKKKRLPPLRPRPVPEPLKSHLLFKTIPRPLPRHLPRQRHNRTPVLHILLHRRQRHPQKVGKLPPGNQLVLVDWHIHKNKKRKH